MRICIHRGAKEIGGSCVQIEAGGESILIDAGMPLTSDSESPPIPPIVDGRSLRGIVISHPHQDHYGLLPWMPTTPVLMGDAARRILRAAAPFMRQPPLNLDGPSLVDRQTVSLGPFRITPYLVDHSAYDSYALLIDADGKRLFYSGDVRVHGRKRKLVERLMATPPVRRMRLSRPTSTVLPCSRCCAQGNQGILGTRKFLGSMERCPIS